jgi:hypothetical protein
MSSSGQRPEELRGLPPGSATVEDLLRAVMLLPQQESAIPVVDKGLHFLDSSATAALLKELAKQGQLRRATEIFDWLRTLPGTHPLAGQSRHQMIQMGRAAGQHVCCGSTGSGSPAVLIHHPVVIISSCVVPACSASRCSPS